MSPSELAQANEVVSPLVIAAMVSKAAFERLAPKHRALVVLWDLATEVTRGGVGDYVRSSTGHKWLLAHVEDACASFQEADLAESWRSIQPNLRPIERGEYDVPGDFAAQVAKTSERLHAYAFENLEELRPIAAAATVKSASRKVAREKAAKAEAERQTAAWETLRPQAKPYSTKDAFRVGDVIDHPTLGLCRVTEVMGDKIRIELPVGPTRVLIHKR